MMIKPIDFKGTNVVIAKDQPEYNPIPAIVLPEEGAMITCWQLDPDDLKVINENGGKIYLKISTFGQPLQPLNLYTDLSDSFRLTK